MLSYQKIKEKNFALRVGKSKKDIICIIEGIKRKNNRYKKSNIFSQFGCYDGKCVGNV